MTDRVYLSPPDIGQAERGLVSQAFDSNWIAPLGPQVDAFEVELAERCGVSAAAALSSGTSALHLALLLAGVGPGDEVICPTLTFVASANPILYVGASPVFVDSDPSTWTLDPELLESALESRARRGAPIKAVIAVDLYGQCADYERIESVCRRHGVSLIEDAAEALGSKAFGRPAGSFGSFAVLSFNGNKIITTSGGGALLSNDIGALERARFLASQAREAAPHYEHAEVGFNYRLSNLLAAVGRGQLSTLDSRVEARRRNFDRYIDGLSHLPGIEFMPEAPYGRSNRWLTTLTIAPQLFGATREDVRMELERHNIEARPVWKPMHLQPLYDSYPMVGGSVSEQIFEDGLCLPSGSALNAAQSDRIVEIVRSAHRP
jgi:pyridoxal phosphate-dependent aminotransferase EpsN